MKRIKILFNIFIIFFLILLSPVSAKAYIAIDSSTGQASSGSVGSKGGQWYSWGNPNKKQCLDWAEELEITDDDVIGNAQLVKWVNDDNFVEVDWDEVYRYCKYETNSGDGWVQTENPWLSDNADSGVFYNEIFSLAVESFDFTYGGWKFTDGGGYVYNGDLMAYCNEGDHTDKVDHVNLEDYSPQKIERWIDKSETRKDPEVNTSVYRISKVYLNNNEIYNKDNDGAFKDENGNFDVSKFYYNGLTSWNYDGVLNNGENAKYNIIYQKVDYHKDEITWERTYEECTSHSDEYIKGQDTAA